MTAPAWTTNPAKIAEEHRCEVAQLERESMRDVARGHERRAADRPSLDRRGGGEMILFPATLHRTRAAAVAWIVRELDRRCIALWGSEVDLPEWTK